ncbi:hypothetical protein [Synechococcus sp. MIT S1220]|uniref:hypothetical protein n=1 Tax=Synechococcus sp. MIT S1220 TaxID=3082549 RepID=UPI0039AFBC5B
MVCKPEDVSAGSALLLILFDCVGLSLAISFGLAPDRVTSRQRASSPVGFSFTVISWVLLRACINAR